MRKRKWYAANDFEGSTFAFAEEKPETSERINWTGPFDTFAEAKKDAIGYHQTTINTARNAIADIREQRAEDFKLSEDEPSLKRNVDYIDSYGDES